MRKRRTPFWIEQFPSEKFKESRRNLQSHLRALLWSMYLLALATLASHSKQLKCCPQTTFASQSLRVGKVKARPDSFIVYQRIFNDDTMVNNNPRRAKPRGKVKRKINRWRQIYGLLSFCKILVKASNCQKKAPFLSSNDPFHCFLFQPSFNHSRFTCPQKLWHLSKRQWANERLRDFNFFLLSPCTGKREDCTNFATSCN